MRLHRAALALAFGWAVGLLAGCVQAPKPLYQWDGYQTQLYEYFKGDGKSTGEHLQWLEAQAQKARAAGAALPPGFRAHMAIVYLRLGRDTEAQQLLVAEKTSFPESTQYMDFLLKRMTAAKAKS